MKQNQDQVLYVEETMGQRFRRLLFRWIRRAILLAVVVLALYGIHVYKHVETIMTGPSPTARERLALSLFEDERTSWLPGRFMSPSEIEAMGSMNAQEKPEVKPEPEQLAVEMEVPRAKEISDWMESPDGIVIKKIPGETFQAYAMLIRDPSRVYLGLSNEKLSSNTPGKRLNEALDIEGAVAGINSGAFYDNGTSDPEVGATPEGLVISEGTCAWKQGTPPSKGFAGFTKDNVLYVSDRNLSLEEANKLDIRDGCCFGPALIIDGVPNKKAYKMLPGRQPRTAIGQREDGTVIFLCIDGRQASSIGGTMEDVVNLMLELGAVNA